MIPLILADTNHISNWTIDFLKTKDPSLAGRVRMSLGKVLVIPHKDKHVVLEICLQKMCCTKLFKA